MKKLMTRESRKKKDKKNQLIIGIVLISLMLFSMLGYAFGGRDTKEENLKKVEHNGIEFIQDNSDYWYFNIQGNDFVTKYNPKEVQDISFFSSLSFGNYVNKPLYIISEFQEPNSEIIRNLDRFILRDQPACLDEDCGEDFPIKNCSVDNVIIINKPFEGESETIYQNENCVFIVADTINQTRYADVFLFNVLGI